MLTRRMIATRSLSFPPSATRVTHWTVTIASALNEGHFYEAEKRFGVCLHTDSIENHNFSCSPREALARYLSVGAPAWMFEPKKTVCRYVFRNWLKMFSEEIDKRTGDLGKEAVARFRAQKEEYLERADDDCENVAMNEKRAIEAVSEFGRSLRDVHKQKSGKKVQLVICE